MSDHAEFAPSSAYRWLPCGLSQKFAKSFIDYPSKAAEKGTALHEIAAKELERGKLSANEDVGMYVNYVYRRFDLIVGSSLFIEKKLVINSDCWGTADACIVSRDFIEIVDLKSGKELVSAIENPQLKLYGLGFIKELGNVPDDKDVFLTIVQKPDKNSPVKTWKTSAGYLRKFERSVDRAIARALQPDPPPLAGDHCTYCKGRMFCEAYKLTIGAKRSLNKKDLVIYSRCVVQH